MGSYSPLFLPGQRVTFKASATITGGQTVKVTGVRTVGPATAASTAGIGIAATDAASGDDVLIYLFGAVHRAKASGAITAADPLILGAAGTVATSATPPAGQQVGVAITTAADTATVEFVAR